MQATDTAQKLRAQIEGFTGIFSPRFSKPQGRFVGQMIFGIEASQDVKLSAIARALGEEIALKKTEERLSHHLQAEGMGQQINEVIAQQAARRVKEQTLIIVDPTDIRKSYARRMPYLGRVRDGSSGEMVNGYWSCLALACEPAARRVIPLHQRLWSARAPDFVSENHQLLQIIDTIATATKGRGIYVLDRGGDRCRLYNPLLKRGLRFIIRLRGDRHLSVRGVRRAAMDWARGCRRRYAERIVKEERAQEKSYHLEYGFRSVKLPGRKAPLTLVVLWGFGQEPLLLLTNLEVKPTRKSVWFIVQSYLTRWLVEETIRFVKQSYRLEDVRVLDYERLRNLVALVLAAVYFSAVWLGESLKLAVLASRVAKVAKRFFGAADFHYYALADGISVLLTRLGRFTTRSHRRGPVSAHAQLLLFSPT
jgi:hypothetical protein